MQTISVIGGTGELCGTMALGLAQAGAEVVLVGRNETKAANRLAQIEAAGGKAWFHAAEATSKASLTALRDASVETEGAADDVVASSKALGHHANELREKAGRFISDVRRSARDLEAGG